MSEIKEKEKELGKNKQYIAIKLKNFSHWLWFERIHVVKANGEFVGLYGWGADGAGTDVKVHVNQIEGEMYSDALQYR